MFRICYAQRVETGTDSPFHGLKMSTRSQRGVKSKGPGKSRQALSAGRGAGRGAGREPKYTYKTPVEGLASTISKQYVLTQRDNEYLSYIVKTWPHDSLSEQLDKMRYFLSTLQEKPVREEGWDTRESYKANKIAQLAGPFLRDVDSSTMSVLDIGAADATILKEVARETGASITYALDPKADNVENVISSLNDLKDGSIDLVIMTQTIHHINPSKRSGLMRDVKRVLSPSGVVIVQEHAYKPNMALHLSLEVLHNYWYVKNNEHPDPFYPMTQNECEELLASIGLVPVENARPEGWQLMYWHTFVSQDTKKAYLRELEVVRPLPKVINESLYVTPDSGLLPWRPHRVGNADKNGQLQMFISTLQALLTFWDRELVPKLTVVYVGAAPGFSIGLINKLSLGEHIQWILYDPSPIVCRGNNITVYNQFFTDKEAKLLAKTPNIFFFSDVRHESRAKNLRPWQMGKDTNVQTKWAKAINPYQLSLKMRVPFEGDKMTCLDGNVMFQSYTSSVSEETRLIPTRDSNGNLYTVDWDIATYREQLHNYNINVRSNSRQRAHLEYVLDMYIEQYQVKETTAELLADSIVREINKFEKGSM